MGSKEPLLLVAEEADVVTVEVEGSAIAIDERVLMVISRESPLISDVPGLEHWNGLFVGVLHERPIQVAPSSAMRSSSKGPTLRTETQKREYKEVRYKGLGRMKSGRETECVTSQLTLLAP